VAGAGQTGDSPVTPGRVARAWAAAGRSLASVAVRAGILDFPVHPVRTRRALSLAAIAYVLGVSGSLAAWSVVLHLIVTGAPVP
jgi:hypothetical protein